MFVNLNSETVPFSLTIYSEDGYDFYVNIDNICLQTELKYSGLNASPELIITRFKYGMFLIGLAMLRELGILESQGKTDSYEQTTVDKIKEFTRAISPVLLPMISSLNKLPTTLRSGY